ncbi:MAG: class II glutamine amidotransferase [Cyanobacteria bacterium K_Offshore_surface_m2_239]|nr:class II glutamine amidotransferase [Cyanobacteria bacterium K_Offshore_surface_m2_239]
MCELLALSANTPTDLCFSFHGLRRRGGATADHADGWGLASFDVAGQGVHLYREDTAAAFSATAARVATLPLKAHCSIAHIRKATRGTVALRNCHPFHRRWHDEDWVFAHNGDLAGEWSLDGPHQPLGDTDSETAFCWMLQELDRAGVTPDDDARLRWELMRLSARIATRGTFNGLLSNGRWLFATASTRLHVLTRRAPFRQARLADDDLSVDFAALAGPNDVVTIVSTEPLTTNEDWQPLPPGQALWIVAGEVLHLEESGRSGGPPAPDAAAESVAALALHQQAAAAPEEAGGPVEGS